MTESAATCVCNFAPSCSNCVVDVKKAEPLNFMAFLGNFKALERGKSGTLRQGTSRLFVAMIISSLGIIFLTGMTTNNNEGKLHDQVFLNSVVN